MHGLSRLMGLYIINEYPKSGGSWLSQMLSASLNVPFPRNRLPTLKSSIIQGHYYYTWNMHNVVVIWRDFRDIVVSNYFYSLFYNDRGNRGLVDNTRRKNPFSDYDAVTENLPEFIQFMYEGDGHPSFTWSQFVRKWADRSDVVYVKYENLLRDTAQELQRVVYEVAKQKLVLSQAEQIAFDYSFSQQAGRQPGEEDSSSFMRKGISGDWKNYFSREARQVLHHYAGKELILLGYERDSSWVND